MPLTPSLASHGQVAAIDRRFAGDSLSEALDHLAHPRRPPDGVDGPPDALGDHHQVGRQVLRQVDPVVVLLARDHERVALRERVDRQEADAALVLPDETAGDLPLDDLRELNERPVSPGCR